MLRSLRRAHCNCNRFTWDPQSLGAGNSLERKAPPAAAAACLCSVNSLHCPVGIAAHLPSPGCHWQPWQRVATGNRGNVWQLATVAACGNWQPWQRVATGTRGKRSNMWQLATVATCGNWQPWQRVATGNRGNVWQLATVATCGNVWQLATVATCGNRQPWQRVAQVLDVQQARGTLEDLSTTTYMTVLTQFERFQIATRPPVCPPPSEPVHLPAASSAERTASGLARAASLAVATPGDASRPVVQDLHHFLPFMRIVSVRFYMTVTQLAALMMDLPDSPDPSQPNLPRCGRVICSSFSTQYM